MVPFTRGSATVAWAAAVGGLLYGFAFVVAGNVTASSLLLMAGGLLSSLILVALGASVTPHETSPGAALTARWAVGVGVLGAVLSVVHGGFDLANQAHPPAAVAGFGDYPSQVDPRGLATFGLVGLAFAVLGVLLRAEPRYPAGLASLEVALGVVMMVIYVGRLVILDPENPVVRIALLAGLVLNTAFLGWLGSAWRAHADAGRRDADTSQRARADSVG
jgi:hypothetical protein